MCLEELQIRRCTSRIIKGIRFQYLQMSIRTTTVRRSGGGGGGSSFGVTCTMTVAIR